MNAESCCTTLTILITLTILTILTILTSRTPCNKPKEEMLCGI